MIQDFQKQDNQANSKRIAKNTMLLYVRMLFLMLISLYTSRVILNALGVEDYGIYNVVGGVVTMFSVLSGSLSAAISRFITFELGRGNTGNLKSVFSSSVTIQAGIAIVVILLAETLGLWFLNYKMTIPENRMIAANWCYQFSIITFVLNLLCVPFNAAIIAHERMSAFAYISILDVLGKLCVAWCIVINPIDRLVFYAAMVAIIAWTISLTYVWYCRCHFVECRYSFFYDYSLLKKMFGFAGWNFIGVAASVLRDHGGNIVINLFCGPAVNASRGIAMKVSAVINGFVQNFMMALNPQIIKSYASENRDYMMNLVFKGARYSYYLLLIISLPILLNTHYLLVLWLKIVPDYTVVFVKLVLIFALHESLANPLVTAMLATGNIKKYQIVAGGLNLLNLPVSYMALYLGYPPESVLIVAIIFSFIVQAARLYLLNEMIGLDILGYVKKVYLNVIFFFFFAILVPMYINGLFEESFVNFLSISIVTILWTLIVIFYSGLKREERILVISKVKSAINKKVRSR